MFLLEEGLFQKGYVESKTLFFSTMALFHYMLILTSMILKEFSCLATVHDSNKFMHKRLACNVGNLMKTLMKTPF